MLVAHPHLTPQERTLTDEVANLTMKAALPLVWHDPREPWPKRLPGGTCFALRFEDRLIGVTAEHVIRAFEDAKREASPLESLLRTVRLDLPKAIIDRDAELDLATFRVNEEHLIESKAIALDCRDTWPPPEPRKGEALSFAGFPEILKVRSYPHLLEFRAFVDVTHAEDVSERTIVATYEPSRDVRVRASPAIPDIGADWSGCSGGPVIMHIERNGLHRWFPAGVIMGGPKKSSRDGTQTSSGIMREFDTFLFRRIHFLTPDGAISS